MKKRKDLRTGVRLRISFFPVILFAVLSVVCILLLRQDLLQNAQQTGTAVAFSYATEEQNNIAVYRTLIQIGTRYIDTQTAAFWNEERIQRWMEIFFNRVEGVLGKNTVDPYAVINGKIIAARPWAGDEAYDVEAADWYRRAVEANGDVVFTDAYQDAITGKPVITIAQMGTESGCVLAFDVFPENFRLTLRTAELPEGSSYYLCDRRGTVLYSTGESTHDDEEEAEYVREILKEISLGLHDEYDSVLYDPSGVKKGVYYNELPNGWKAIITIPFHEIFGELNRLIAVFSLFFACFLMMTLFLSVRDWRLQHKIGRSNETVRVLGNSYYALYRVNVNDASYEIIKGSEYVLKRLPVRGDYERLLDVMREIIEPNACRDFLDSFSAEKIGELLDKKIHDFGGDFRRRFGSVYKWVNVRVLFDETLTPGEAVLCFREVEREKVQQLQRTRLLEEALEAARRSEETQSSFFSSMSHDMRTPLNAVIGLSELAQKQTDNPGKVKELLDRIRIAGRQLLDLINDILEMSRIRHGKVTISQQPFDLKETIEETVSIFRIQAEKDEKEFTVETDIRDSRVVGDPLRISQILNNLLSNAFKFTERGGRISFQVKQFETGGYSRYQFVIEDDGIGMSPEFVEKVFEPYERESRFGAESVGGTGLGMSIVKSLVTQMDGKITVKSAPGEGSRFTVTVPLEAAAPVSDTFAPATAAAESGKGPSAGTDEGCPGRGRRLLLAEDNAINRLMAEEMLVSAGFEVTSAENGRRALELFEESAPGTFAVVLMDMQMPVMDGCEAARQIRALDRPDAGAVPIIAVTANAFSEDVSATTAAGMDAHVSKPIDFAVLRQTLERLLSPRTE